MTGAESGRAEEGPGTFERRHLTRFICALLLATGSPIGAQTANVDGYGDWRFGMSREEVLAVREAEPYTTVALTGGLETANGRFLGERTHISFVFGTGGLYLISIWAYEGPDQEAAFAAFERVYRHLVAEFGAVHSSGVTWPSDLSSDALIERIPDSFRRNDPIDPTQLASGTRLQTDAERIYLQPVDEPAETGIYVSFNHSGRLGTYWVFLNRRSHALAP